jgi:adenylate cyclase
MTVISPIFLRQRAINLDLIFAGGYTGLAAALHRAGTLFQTRNQADALGTAEALARNAVELDGGDAEARARLAIALHALGDHQGAQAEAERALRISPNLADAHGALGVVLTFSGRPKEGLAALKTCIRLDPRAPALVYRLFQIALALYFCREYPAAIEAARQAIRSYPNRVGSYRVLAAALGQMGRAEEAKEALEKAIAIAPTAVDAYVRWRYPGMRPKDHAHMIEGLRKAGMPEE